MNAPLALALLGHVLFLLGSALIIVAVLRTDRPEDLGAVSAHHPARKPWR